MSACELILNVPHHCVLRIIYGTFFSLSTCPCFLLRQCNIVLLTEALAKAPLAECCDRKYAAWTFSVKHTNTPLTLFILKLEEFTERPLFFNATQSSYFATLCLYFIFLTLYVYACVCMCVLSGFLGIRVT